MFGHYSSRAETSRGAVRRQESDRQGHRVLRMIVADGDVVSGQLPGGLEGADGVTPIVEYWRCASRYLLQQVAPPGATVTSPWAPRLTDDWWPTNSSSPPLWDTRFVALGRL